MVIVNCKDVAMHAFDWKHTLFHFNKVRFPAPITARCSGIPPL